MCFYSLSRDDFLSISDLIVIIIPSELAIRYYKKAEHGSAASGKLFNAFHNQRSELAKINVITLRPKTKRLKGNTLTNKIF